MAELIEFEIDRKAQKKKWFSEYFNSDTMKIIGIGVLSFAVSTWYITFMMALHAIFLVFTIIISFNKNYNTLA